MFPEAGILYLAPLITESLLHTHRRLLSFLADAHYPPLKHDPLRADL